MPRRRRSGPSRIDFVSVSRGTRGVAETGGNTLFQPGGKRETTKTRSKSKRSND